jgi:hypothetical protein
MNPEKVLKMLLELRALRFFPNDEAVMDPLVRLCGSMCESEAQVRWLVTRMTSGIYTEWPGIAEVRACFCCRFRPKDGLSICSSIFPSGLPPDPTAPPRREIAGPDLKALPPGEPVTADPELEASIRQFAEKHKMPAHPEIDAFGRMLRDLETPPDKRQEEQEEPINLNFKPITQADIDRAVQELHERRAREAEESADAPPKVLNFPKKGA